MIAKELIFLLISIAVFAYPVIIFLRMAKMAKQFHQGAKWIVLMIFTGFFLLGYVFVAFAEAIGYEFHSANFVIVIMFFGAVFVAIVACMFYRSIKTLDKVVDERTDDLVKAMHKAVTKEKKIQKLKDHFVFIAAHELRSPVTAIKWNIETLEEELTKLTKKQRGIISDLNANNNRLVDLIDDLLDTSRIQYGTFKVNLKKFDVCEVMAQAIKETKVAADNKLVSISCEDHGKKIYAYADPKRTQEVLVNLLTNAIKYNYPKGRVNIFGKVNNGEVRICVQDEGIGLSEADIRKLFRKFSRISREETVDILGTGLGLYIVKQIVERMNGRIWVESDGRGRGSTFCLTLPRKKGKK